MPERGGIPARRSVFKMDVVLEPLRTILPRRSLQHTSLFFAQLPFCLSRRFQCAAKGIGPTRHVSGMFHVKAFLLA